jgi:hypothetical protein
MNRTAGLIVFAVAVLLSAAAFAAPVDGNPECCPCPAAGGEGGGEVSSENLENAPDTVVLDEMAEFYGPVEFTHSDHSDYAEEGCTECHHHQSPAERFKPCGACHDRKPFQGAEKMNTPGLQGAFHRQCLDCHVEAGSGPTECADCHELRARKEGKEE